MRRIFVQNLPTYLTNMGLKAVFLWKVYLPPSLHLKNSHINLVSFLSLIMSLLQPITLPNGDHGDCTLPCTTASSPSLKTVNNTTNHPV